MGIGSILVGVAVLLVVAAYLARPFRIAKIGVDLDRAIETWVAQVRAERQAGRRAGGQDGMGAEERPAYCTQCGRRVGPDDRFCAGCGARLGDGSME